MAWSRALYITLAICFLLVLVVELGQLFLPKRRFDWADVGFGILGGALGGILGGGWRGLLGIEN